MPKTTDPFAQANAAWKVENDFSDLGATPVDDYSDLGGKAVDEGYSDLGGTEVEGQSRVVREARSVVEAPVPIMRGLGEKAGDVASASARVADMAAQGQWMAPRKAFRNPGALRSQENIRALDDPQYFSEVLAARDQGELGAVHFDRSAAKAVLDRNKRMETSGLYQWGRDQVKYSRQVFKGSPDLNDTAVTQLAEAFGGMIPDAVLSAVPVVGPALASVSYGLQAGQQQAQEAIDAGHPEKADMAFASAAGLGMISERAIGVAPRFWRMVKAGRAAGMTPTKFGSVWSRWVRSHPKTAKIFEGSVREFVQEGTEQAGQNYIASDIANYDQQRPIFQGVPKAALMGGALGGIFGGIAGVGHHNIGPKNPAAAALEREMPDVPLTDEEILTTVPESARGRVRIVNNASELPTSIREQFDGDPDTIDGAYHQIDGVVYLNRAQLPNSEIAGQKVIHELAIHAGLRVALGEEAVMLLGQQAWEALSPQQREDTWKRNRLNPSDTARVGEEWLAYEAERVWKKGKTDTVWGRIADGVRRWLQQHGVKVKLSDMQIAELIARGLRAVGEPAAAAPQVTPQAASQDSRLSVGRGYVGHSKSVNAVNAEREGRFPASKVAQQLGVPTAFILDHAPTDGEWHHTSKFYNTTTYYDLNEVKAWMEGTGDYVPEGSDPTGNDTLAEWKMAQQAAKDAGSDVVRNASIKYLEWSGTRNHPHAREVTENNVTIERKPGKKQVTITRKDGSKFRKGLETRGFEIFDPAKDRWWDAYLQFDAAAKAQKTTDEPGPQAEDPSPARLSVTQRNFLENLKGKVGDGVLGAHAAWKSLKADLSDNKEHHAAAITALVKARDAYQLQASKLPPGNKRVDAEWQVSQFEEVLENHRRRFSVDNKGDGGMVNQTSIAGGSEAGGAGMSVGETQPGTISPSASLISAVQASGVPAENDGGLNIGRVLFSIRNWQEWSNKHLRKNKAVRALYSEEDIEGFIDGMRATVAIFGEDFSMLPEEVPGSPIRDNSDPLFRKTFDLTTICPMQDQYNAIINTLEKEIGKIYTPHQRFLIGIMMEETGVMPACWYCYGASGRNAFDSQIAAATNVFNKIADMLQSGETLTPELVNAAFGTWKSVKLREAVTSIAPRMAATGMRLNEVEVRDAARGMTQAEGLKGEAVEALRSWAQAATKANKPKGFSPYNNQIMTMSQHWIDTFNRAAGFRLNSQTDLRPWHVIDTAQFLAHLGARGGMAHVYTRVPEFVKIFGKTNLKVNLSVELSDPTNLPMEYRTGQLTYEQYRAALKKYGPPRWNEMGGMPKAEALKLRKNPNVGTMLVATSEYQLWWALDSPLIDMVIPYHAGAVPPSVNEYQRVNDFTNEQHENWNGQALAEPGPNGTTVAKVRKVKMSDGSTVTLTPFKANNNWVMPITREHHKNSHDRYIKLMEKLGVTPRFVRFKDHKGYMKMVRDTAKISEQKPVDVSKIDWKAAEKFVSAWAEKGGTQTDITPNPALLQNVRERIEDGDWPTQHALLSVTPGPGQGVGQTSEKLKEDPRLPGDVKDKLPLLYEKFAFDQSEAGAKKLVEELGGPESAGRALIKGELGDPQYMSPFLVSEILTQLSRISRALAKTNPKAVEDIGSLQFDLVKFISAVGSRSGQTQVAMKALYANFSPTAWLREYRSVIGEVTKNRLEAATGRDDVGNSAEEHAKVIADAVADMLEADGQPKVAKEIRERWGSSEDYVRAKTLADKILEKLETRANAARARLAKKWKRTNMMVDPSMLADLVEIGVYHLAKVGHDKALWVKAMIDELSESVRPYLDEIFAKAEAAEAGEIDAELGVPKPKAPSPKLEKVFLDAVDKWRKQHKIPKFDEAGEKWVVAEARTIDQLQENSIQRREAAYRLTGEILWRRGLNWWELTTEYVLGNVLSGGTTQVRNIRGNLLNSMSEFLMLGLRNPLAIPDLIRRLGVQNGSLAAGVMEALNIWRTGIDSSGRTLNKFDTPGTFERIKSKPLRAIITPWLAVFRTLRAMDMMFYFPLQEGRAVVLARHEAGKQGVPITMRSKFAADLLHWDMQSRLKADAQANEEGLTGMTRKRRVRELLDQMRPPMLMRNSREYGLLGVYQNDVYGVIGAMTRAMNGLIEALPPYTYPFKWVVMFTTVPANVFNSGLNWTPVGFFRAAAAHRFRILKGKPNKQGKLFGKAVTDPMAIADEYARATIGTLALMALGAAVAQYIDDDDPPLWIHGRGPTNPKQRDQWLESGGLPNSVKIGDTYHSYIDTVLMVPLGMLGSVFDAIRYNKLGQEDLTARMTYALGSFWDVLMGSSWMSGLKTLFTTRPTKQSHGGIVNWAGRSASTFIPMQSAMKQIDQLFDPTKYSESDIESMLMARTPFARRENYPDLGMFGDEIQWPLSKAFISHKVDDKLINTLADRRLWIVVPDQADYTPEEYYDLIRIGGPQVRSALMAPAIWDVIQNAPTGLADKVVKAVSGGIWQGQKAIQGVGREEQIQDLRVIAAEIQAWNATRQN